MVSRLLGSQVVVVMASPVRGQFKGVINTSSSTVRGVIPGAEPPKELDRKTGGHQSPQSGPPEVLRIG